MMKMMMILMHDNANDPWTVIVIVQNYKMDWDDLDLEMMT